MRSTVSTVLAAVTMTLCIACSSGESVSRNRPSYPIQSARADTTKRQLTPPSNAAQQEAVIAAQVKNRIAEVVAATNRAQAVSAKKFQSEIARVGVAQAVLERLTRAQLEKLGHSGGSAAPRDKESIDRIITTVLCRTPLLLFSDIGNPDPAGYAHLPSDVVMPGAQLALQGCGFGKVPGVVTLTLKVSGQQYPLNVDNNAAGWAENLIWVDVPFTISGVLDQEAKIVVENSSNASSNPAVVHFVAARDTQRVDTGSHRDLVSVNPECYTAATDDSCGGAPVGDPRWPDGRSFVGVHFKQCCSSVNGTDVYQLKFKNGWTASAFDPVWGPYFVSEYGVDQHYDGFTTCWWFNNHRSSRPVGRIGGEKAYLRDGSSARSRFARLPTADRG